MGIERLHLRMGRPRWDILAVVIAVLVGLYVRLYRLGDTPLVSLEIYTWDFSKQAISFILGRLSQIETNPPLYYLLMHFIMKSGDSEFIMRLPSVVSGTLAIPLVYLLARLGRVPISGVIGAALLALSAINISYDREARAYPLVQVFCLLAAIGAVVIINAYRARPSEERMRQQGLGWFIFTVASIAGFYLHYTFLFEVCVIELTILAVWLSQPRLEKRFFLAWFLSCVVLIVAMGWGLTLVQNQAYSDNISWIQIPSLQEAADLLVQVDGYSSLYRFQPWASVLLMALAFVGLVVGWRRSAAILVCGSLFIVFPVLLFGMSQIRPVFIERVLVPPSFSVYLLAGLGCLHLLREATRYSKSFSTFRATLSGLSSSQRFFVPLTATLMLVPALISARNSLREAPVLEPYDKVAEYLAATVKPGDTAVGTDGVIYYRRKFHANFPYFKLVDSESAESQITYGSPAIKTDEVRKLAHVDNAIYLVLREKLQSSTDIRESLSFREPPENSFGALGIYRLSGACPGSAPCFSGILAEIGGDVRP